MDQSTTSSRILTGREEELRQRAAAVVEELAGALRQISGSDEDVRLLNEAAEQLHALFLLVVVGEFNAGKSALINALLHADVMPEGVTPTTSAIHLLRYGPTPAEHVLPGGIVEHVEPADLLRDVNLVDTPGTNAIIREHEALTQRFVPRADLVLFVTSADRPFTESERQFMEEIRNWGKKIVVVVNKIDLLDSERDRAEVMTFVRANARRLLGLEPEMFPVSARLARLAQRSGDADERERAAAASHFGPFEQFIVESLDESARIQLKILSPLGVADRIGGRYRTITLDHLAMLDRDAQTLERIEERLTRYRTEMEADFAGYRARIESIIHRLNTRADRFFDEAIRLGRLFDLFQRDRIQAEFQEQVIADTERQIDETVAEMVDWMVAHDLQVWQEVTEFIQRRELDRYRDELVGEPTAQFRYDRQALLAGIGRRARETVDRYDPQRESEQVAQSMRDAVTQTALAEAGAVGLGAVVVAIATTATLDATGVLAAITVGGLGLLILPARKRRAREVLHQRSAELHDRLIAVITDQFNRELERSVARVRSAVAPYAGFVRDERDRLQRLATTLDAIDADIRDLRREVAGEPLPESR